MQTGESDEKSPVKLSNGGTSIEIGGPNRGFPWKPAGSGIGEKSLGDVPDPGL